MVPMVILPFIIYDENQNLAGNRVFVAALLMGFLCFQVMIKNTEIRVDADVTLNEEAPKFNVIKAMGNFLKKRPAVGATLAAVGMFIGMQGAATAVTVLFQSYFKNVQLSGVVSMFSMIPMIMFTPFARKLAQGVGPAIALVFMAALGYVGANEGNQTAEAALNMRYLVAALYFVSAAMQFIGLGIVYNLDKKTTAKMQDELNTRHAAAQK